MRLIKPENLRRELKNFIKTKIAKFNLQPSGLGSRSKEIWRNSLKNMSLSSYTGKRAALRSFLIWFLAAKRASWRNSFSGYLNSKNFFLKREVASVVKPFDSEGRKSAIIWKSFKDPRKRILCGSELKQVFHVHYCL